MLSELFHYLTTSCPPAHRRLGYLSGLIAIQARYQRIGQQWENHLHNTRQLILKAVQQCPQHDKVVVLGSGLLLDVPLAQLSQCFKEVVLIDVVQLRSIRQHCKKLSNVTLLEYDITGLAAPLLTYRRHDPLPSPEVKFPDFILASDLIISCNLLSQLALTPNQFLQQHHNIKAAQLQSWCRAILENHLTALIEHTGQCCLISDIQHNYLDVNNSLLERQEMLFGLSLGTPDQEWQWALAPLGEVDKHYQLHATVQGFYNCPPVPLLWTTSNPCKDSQ